MRAGLRKGLIALSGKLALIVIFYMSIKCSRGANDPVFTILTKNNVNIIGTIIIIPRNQTRNLSNESVKNRFSF